MSTTNKQIVVIYHRADFDGIFCREIASKFLGETAEYIGWHYGDAVPEISPHVTLYMLDISIEALMEHPGLIWIDHHKSAMEQFNKTIPGYRIDGVAACRLTWQYFATLDKNTGIVGPLTLETALAILPNLEAYGGPIKDERGQVIGRHPYGITEPWAVELAGRYDVWDKKTPDVDTFQHGLRSCALSENMWLLLLGPSLTDGDGKRSTADITVEALLDAGRALEYAQARQNESIIKDLGFTYQWEGLTFLVCNHARYNSLLFTAGLKPEHDACMGFKYLPRGEWELSLYHAPGKEHHDLSVIAKKHGGGGHRGACGFRLKTLPWSAEAKLRPALEQLVGAATEKDLRQMQEVLTALPDCENKTVALPAVCALLETL